ncbi:MAG: inositol monophosphatase family protein [Litorivicinaceae bacterium]
MSDTALASAAIREAGQLARAFFERRHELLVDQKGPQDYVSAADREVESCLIARLSQLFPADGFVGEESGQRDGAREWVIDPIDGTTNFLRGIPVFAITLALVEADVTQLGLIYDPMRDVLYEATAGGRARCNGEPIQPLWRDTLSQSLIGLCHPSRLHPEQLTARISSVLQSGAILRQPGSAALMLCDLAMGRIDGLYDADLKAWDSVAGLLIAREAGAIASNFLAKESWRTAPQPTLAVAPGLYPELSALWPEIRDIPCLP